MLFLTYRRIVVVLRTSSLESDLYLAYLFKERIKFILWCLWLPFGSVFNLLPMGNNNSVGVHVQNQIWRFFWAVSFRTCRTIFNGLIRKWVRNNVFHCFDSGVNFRHFRLRRFKERVPDLRFRLILFNCRRLWPMGSKVWSEGLILTNSLPCKKFCRCSTPP